MPQYWGRGPPRPGPAGSAVTNSSAPACHSPVHSGPKLGPGRSDQRPGRNSKLIGGLSLFWKLLSAPAVYSQCRALDSDTSGIVRWSGSRSNTKPTLDNIGGRLPYWNTNEQHYFSESFFALKQMNRFIMHEITFCRERTGLKYRADFSIKLAAPIFQESV